MKNTREIAAEYRMTYWAGIMKKRVESGLSIRGFCEAEGMHVNRYHYWQRKLREATVAEIMPAKKERVIAAVPAGWTAVKVTEEPKAPINGEVVIEIGKCRVVVKDNINPETLRQVCQVLVEIC